MGNGKRSCSAAVVFDLEFTAWEGVLPTRWMRPGEFKEIVQIGAFLVDDNFVPLDSFERLVRPRINSVLSDYLVDLIGITNADIAARGVDFLDAYRAFLAFADGLPLFAYGRDDLVFEDNLRLYGIRGEAKIPPYTNVVHWMGEQGIDIRKAHSCNVGPAAGVPFQGHEHNALDDARSVAAGINALLKRGAPSPLISPPSVDETEAGRIVRALKLEPHPEGGAFRETFRDPAGVGGRAHSTAIYYLLRAGEESKSHRIDAAEVWHFYRGDPLELTIREEGKPAIRHVLGPDVTRGEEPQIVVPARAWQSAKPLGAYALVGCTVAPGFVFETFEME
jgi:uncharacterized protein